MEKELKTLSAENLTTPLSSTSIEENNWALSGEKFPKGDDGIDGRQTVERSWGEVAAYSHNMSTEEKNSTEDLIAQARMRWHDRMKPCR
jgi:hypothetical protein